MRKVRGRKKKERISRSPKGVINYHERNQIVLPHANNLLQAYLEDTEIFANQNQMIINNKKTKTICFNTTRKWNFPPEVNFMDEQIIECVREIKLVGVIISDDLKWGKNTRYICQKAMGENMDPKENERYKVRY